MIEADWQEIIGAIVLLIGGIGSAAASGKWFMSARKTAMMSASAVRIADTGPPEGAVAWVADLVSAMSDAPPESKLQQILIGANRDQAQAARIAELEGKK